jgi:rhodanese-related sulfurtransferase
MKIKVFIVSFLLSSASFAQMVQSKAYGEMLNGLLSHKAKEISVAEAKKISDVTFVDAREKNEFNVSHLKNAVWCGYDDFDINRLKSVDGSKKVIVYCSVGYRSEKISLKLKKLGFTNVFNLYGGIFEWKNQGNPVYDNQGNETEKVHAYDEKWGVWLTSGEKVYNSN